VCTGTTDVAECEYCFECGSFAAFACAGFVDPADTTECLPGGTTGSSSSAASSGSGGNVPAEWTCDVGFYQGDDGCDCACGAYDPDCDDGTSQVFGCALGTTCLASPDGSTCSAPPVAWTCPASFFGRLDGCDCECGAYDPDCDRAGESVFNCNAGETCVDSADGTCG